MLRTINIYHLLFVLIFGVISCGMTEQERFEHEAWENLYALEIEEAYPKFKRMYEQDKTKKNALGFACSQAVLDSGNYSSTLSEVFSSNDHYKYGMLVTSFKMSVKPDTIAGVVMDRQRLEEFPIIEFRAMIEGTSFKRTDWSNNIIEGQYKDLKPYGTWTFYSQDGKVLRTIDASKSFDKD